jgi:hypothetical protein
MEWTISMWIFAGTIAIMAVLGIGLVYLGKLDEREKQKKNNS